MLRLLQLLIRLEWPLRLISPAFGKFNPFLKSFRRDPYPRYAKLRESDPVYRHKLLRIWVLTRYADCDQVLRNSTFSVDRTSARGFQGLIAPLSEQSPAFGAAIRNALLMQDPPNHTRLRGLVNKAFTPRAIEKLRPRIQQLVDELIDPLPSLGRFDLVSELAVPLPVIAISELLGIPVHDRGQMKLWSDELASLVDPLQLLGRYDRLAALFDELQAYFGALFEARRKEPRDDLISALVAVEEEGDRLNPSELLSLVALIMGAGHETTTNLIGNSVLALLRNPGERRRLQDDPDLIESAVEEFLRYDSPVQVTDRIATEAIEVGGVRFEPGALVLTALGAANRDPARFPEPDRLDLGRTDNRHLAFSAGVHFCLGAPLARLETQIVINSLLRRLPDFAGETKRVEHTRSIVLRGPVSLPIHCT